MFPQKDDILNKFITVIEEHVRRRIVACVAGCAWADDAVRRVRCRAPAAPCGLPVSPPSGTPARHGDPRPRNTPPPHCPARQLKCNVNTSPIFILLFCQQDILSSEFREDNTNILYTCLMVSTAILVKNVLNMKYLLWHMGPITETTFWY